MPAKKKIIAIRIEHKQDDSPDSSYLGTFANVGRGWANINRKSGQLIDREGNVLASDFGAKHSRGEVEFITDFQHTLTGWEHVTDKEVRTAFLRCRYKGNGLELGRGNENLFAYFGVIGWQNATTRADKIRALSVVYCCIDALKLERLSAGEWYYMGIIAKAVIQSGADIDTTQTLRSGGIWGIESFSDAPYIAEEEGTQLEELRRELEAFGFGKRQIDFAFQHVSHAKE